VTVSPRASKRAGADFAEPHQRDGERRHRVVDVELELAGVLGRHEGIAEILVDAADVDHRLLGKSLERLAPP
jgi:hypothetical protein